MTQAMAPRNQHWAQINEFSFVAGMRVLYWLCRLVGRGPVRLILYPVLFWYFISKPAARTASRDYLRRVTTHGAVLNEDLGRLTVFRHFAAFAECILDKMLLWSGLFEADSVKYQGQALIAAQIGKNRGALLICCHLQFRFVSRSVEADARAQNDRAHSYQACATVQPAVGRTQS